MFTISYFIVYTMFKKVQKGSSFYRGAKSNFKLVYYVDMPSRNTVKQYDSPAYYHVYNRGAGGRAIYLDVADRQKFLSLLERHLSPSYIDRHPESIYAIYDVELAAYCLMGNHFHLLLYQEKDPDQISALMRSVSTAYSMYFNRKYKSQGHLFQNIFRAARITNEPYLAHISRYIHLNPETYRTYKWSSLEHYLGDESSDWVHPRRAQDMDRDDYLRFLEDYKDRRLLLKEIKSELAL